MPGPIARSRANLDASPVVNRLYSAIEAEFDNIFSNMFSILDFFDPDLYVSKRSSEQPLESINTLLKRLPKDVASGVNAGLLGYHEIDLLDFILNYKTNKVLSVVGSTGSGKSTLLKYFSYFLQDELPSLSPYRLIYIDILSVDRINLSAHFFLQLISTALRQSIKNDRGSSRFDNATSLQDLDQLTSRALQIEAFSVIDLHKYIKDARVLLDRDLIFIFDNLDLLAPVEVVKLSALARSIYFGTNQATIISLRPSSDTIRVEYARDKSAFFPFVLNLTSPLLVDVIWKRFDRTISSVKPSSVRNTAIVDAHNFRITISDLEGRVKTVFENVLNNELQDILLKKMCNNNVRLALVAFKNFLRYRYLSFNLLFAYGDSKFYPYMANQRSVNDLDHLIDGIMIGDRQCYSESWRDSVIENIFYFSCPELPTASHIMQYYVLALLGQLGRHVSFENMQKHLRAFGYPSIAIRRCLAKLVKRGLLTTPDGADTEWPHYVAITETGTYYLDTLILHTQYLLNVVADIDLDTNPANMDDFKRFSVRLASIGRLIERLAEEENSSLSKLTRIEVRDSEVILYAISNYQPLTKRIWHTFDRMATQRIVRAEGEVRKRLTEERREIHVRTGRNVSKLLKSIEETIGALTNSNRLAAISRERFAESSLVGVGSVELYHPEMISSLTPNKVDVSFMPSFQVEDDEIMAEWYGAEGNFYSRILFVMRRNTSISPFKGEFRIEHAGPDIKFPPRSAIKFFEADALIGGMQIANMAA
jgi:energy-coupling factor transporter ATP-binding protein EcfA2/DNA-binding MarR family transcriptional regulator